MDRRFATFLTLSAVVVIVNFTIMWWVQKNQPPAPRKKAAQVAAKRDTKGEKEPDKKVPDKVAPDKKADANSKPKPAEKPDAEKEAPAEPAPDEPVRKEPAPEWVSLGSADPNEPYRMLVTMTNRGAAVERIELSSRRFHDLDDRSGYLGHLEGTKPRDKAGCLVRVVGPGTPAAKAGLKPGDLVTALNGEAVPTPATLDYLLGGHEPGDTVELTVDRQGKQQTLTATLARKPLQVIRPEGSDPLSFLLTLDQIDRQTIPGDEEELPGVRLRSSNWTVLPRDPDKPDEVAFEYVLDKQQLRVVKTYSVARVADADQESDNNAPHLPAYHLNLRIELQNLGEEAKEVAYRLDGPTGLPIEGWWYALNSKIGHSGSPGMRDISLMGAEAGQRPKYYQINAVRLADDELPPPYTDIDLVYAGVDAQYVACMLIPQVEGETHPRFAKVLPVRAGPVPQDKNKKKLVDTSCRLISDASKLEPGKLLVRDFQIFAGPKRPDLLAQYAKPAGMGDLVYYGWFGWVSEPMLRILHFFYAIVGNYGLAIIMLTVLVRSCMFPLSRKQALNAAKMQELQPELKKLTDKYKNPEERMRAQRELFRKNNYHPLSGCLPALVQLPIFLGLYRSLAVDIELRQAPLISESLRWCSNLGAPDMFWYWRPYLPFDFLTDEAAGWLGPYLNVLPLVTIALFIVQQKMFLPPPTDEQAAMQQKMMQYMMIFMGVMFFKVASGLCLYFIASSLWGIAERKLLPKPAPKGAATAGGEAAARLPSPPGPNGSGKGNRKSKQRPRK
ncbi:MAG TPA: YidC/Oxa1 family insertase periplasmic-domain containing protein [Pirellulales bacterium]|nr:YidC/Oxa1 family insertase periplasmic-domain containing protein [Pirellulales bacterium]